MAIHKIRILNEQGKVEARFAVKALSCGHAIKKADKIWLKASGRFPHSIEAYNELGYKDIPDFIHQEYKLIKIRG